MERSRPDGAAIAVSGLTLAAAVWTTWARAVPVSAAVPALLVPVLFVLAGVLGPLWSAARFTARALVAIGGLHLLGLASSAAARVDPAASGAWHAASLLLFSVGFLVLLPLAAGYPSGPAPRPSIAVASVGVLLPAIGTVSGPTPAVLQSDGPTRLLGPLVPLLPSWVAGVSTAVFLAPLGAVVVGVVRAARGNRETRGRLQLPLIALGIFALLLAVASVVPAGSVGTAVFLVAAPLVPAGLVLGARPLAAPLEAPRPVRFEGALDVLSPREREVLAAMADGQTNAVIAQRLHLSLSAVEKHSTAIFTKLGLPPDAVTHRRVAAVVAYLRAAR